jgi:hypothetical protein
MPNPVIVDLGVSGPVTDSITQVNTEILGDAPAMAMGNLFQSTSQAIALAALNATNAQQQNNMSAQATTTMGVTTIYSIQTATDAVGASDILSGLKDRGYVIVPEVIVNI